MVEKTKKDLLGAVRLASEVSKIDGDSWTGDNVPMKNWLQLTVTADNTQGVWTICVGQFVSFSRKSEERILVVDKDLTYSLGFGLVPEQITGRRLHGLDPVSVLGDGPPPRTLC